MNRKLFAALTASVLCLAPVAAHAQSSDSATVSLSADVEEQCVLGSPSLTTLSLGDMTGPDGKLTSTMTGASALVSAQIDNAWCNAPSTLSVNAEVLSMGTSAPAYATPAGFSRLLTYDAAVSGWPSPVVDSPVNGDTGVSTAAVGAHAESLLLEISGLDTLNSAGTAVASGMVVEAGTYSGAIVLSLSINP
ncbi:hypothetical protein [Brevundimonas lenta]|uniref:Spore coat protein U domain-containing protein n=1 Tax=Brevundimonas lenta TaxID=424796 RepID=A0A7W6NPA9_9CAUL|nr:hypothetical protein [Brevundimonas lenta]MBB4082324.1 hypothetical protein [Brevundimonas lenta]